MKRRTKDEARRTVLRILADASLAERLEPLGTIRVPCRELMDPGSEIAVEVSFGALADPVSLGGRVQTSQVTEIGSSRTRYEVTMRVDVVDHDRLAYVRAVADGRREASARAHRRVEADLPVQWSIDGRRQRGRLVDISRGGAFIRHRSPPPVGEHLEVRLELAEAQREHGLRVRSRVAWVRNDGPDAGFGVEFRVADRDEATKIAHFVRLNEAD